MWTLDFICWIIRGIITFPFQRSVIQRHLNTQTGSTCETEILQWSSLSCRASGSSRSFFSMVRNPAALLIFQGSCTDYLRVLTNCFHSLFQLQDHKSSGLQFDSSLSPAQICGSSLEQQNTFNMEAIPLTCSQMGVNAVFWMSCRWHVPADSGFEARSLFLNERLVMRSYKVWLCLGVRGCKCREWAISSHVPASETWSWHHVCSPKLVAIECGWKEFGCNDHIGMQMFKDILFWLKGINSVKLMVDFVSCTLPWKF
jgi:hypothetical protein